MIPLSSPSPERNQPISPATINSIQRYIRVQSTIHQTWNVPHLQSSHRSTACNTSNLSRPADFQADKRSSAPICKQWARKSPDRASAKLKSQIIPQNRETNLASRPDEYSRYSQILACDILHCEGNTCRAANFSHFSRGVYTEKQLIARMAIAQRIMRLYTASSLSTIIVLFSRPSCARTMRCMRALHDHQRASYEDNARDTFLRLVMSGVRLREVYRVLWRRKDLIWPDDENLIFNGYWTCEDVGLQHARGVPVDCLKIGFTVVLIWKNDYFHWHTFDYVTSIFTIYIEYID